MVRRAQQEVRGPKSGLAALRQHLDGEAGPPLELLEARVVEKFGWTWDELDRQDETRTQRALAYLNLATGYRMVMDALERHGLTQVNQAAWEAYKLVVDSKDEVQ